MKNDDKQIETQCCDEDGKQEDELQSKPSPPVAEETTQDDALRRDMESLKAGFVRLQADFDNYRKRVEKERVAWLKYAVEPVLPDLLDIMDDLERAINAGCGEAQDGICAIWRKLLTSLEKQNVKPFESLGQPFDPHYHDAVAVVKEDVPRDVVKEVLLKGYTLYDKVARHARVVVASPMQNHGASNVVEECCEGREGCNEGCNEGDCTENNHNENIHNEEIMDKKKEE